MRALVCSALLAVTACAHTGGFVVSGYSLNSVGDQFVVVAAYMNEAVKSGAVSHEQYNKFAEFGAKFQAAYPAAVHLWKIAVLANDKILEQRAIDAIMALVPELLSFAQEVGLTLEELK